MRVNEIISIIMPAFNEAPNISAAIDNIIQAIEKLQVDVEIIVVNDGSTDETKSIVENIMSVHPFIRLLNHPEKCGLGVSYWDGVNLAKGDIITWLPGDGENDAHEILRYLSVMSHVDIVIPFVYNKNIRTWQRQMISKIYKAIINFSFGLLLNYMNGTVMYRKAILQSISVRNKGFFFQTELLIKSIKAGYLYAEVPYALKTRQGGTSKALTWKDLYRVVIGYITVVADIYVFDRSSRTVVPDSVTAMREREMG